MSKIKGVQVLGAPKASFTNPLKDVHTARLPIAGCGWVETTDGVGPDCSTARGRVPRLPPQRISRLPSGGDSP